MGGYPRYCVQCGNDLAPSTRFCGNCGHASTSGTPAAETEAASQNVTNPDVGASAPAIETRAGGLPPVPPAPRTAAVWRDATPSGSMPPGPTPPGPASLGPAQPGLTPPSFATPPTGPAYPPPPLPSPAEPPSSLPAPSALPPADSRPAESLRLPEPLRPADSAPPLTGPAYPPAPTAPVYTRAERPTPPPPDRPMPPPPDRTGSEPRPSYPPPPAQYALSAGPPAPPPPGTPTGETAKFGNSWMEEVGFNPQWEQRPPMSRWASPARPAITDARAADGPPRPRRALVAGLVLLVAAVLVVPALLIVHALHGLGGASAAATRPTSKPAKSAAAAPTEKAAATALAALLAQSVGDRDTIVHAVGAVNHCSSDVSQAPAQFQEGATSRQRLLKQLASMPGRSELPAAMLQHLTTAWQASATVDEDLSKWANDEVSSGCHAHNDANLAASNGPDIQASSNKSAFVSMWNQIAAKYGLTRYSTGQL